jgi:hypothetical protein
MGMLERGGDVVTTRIRLRSRPDEQVIDATHELVDDRRPAQHPVDGWITDPARAGWEDA